MGRRLVAGLVFIAADLVGCIVPLPHGAFMMFVPTGAIRGLVETAAADAGDSEGTAHAERSAATPDERKSQSDHSAVARDAAASTASGGPEGGPKPFDRGAARGAIMAAIARAEQMCHPPLVQGEATVTYDVTGSATHVVIDPPLADSAVRDCLSSALFDARVPPYEGGPVDAKKRFSFGPRAQALQTVDSSASSQSRLPTLPASTSLPPPSSTWSSSSAHAGSLACEAKPNRDADGSLFVRSSPARWQSAIDNYVVSVRPGRELPLAGAALSFAKYLNAMHVRIHQLFSCSFLDSLDALPPNEPFNDRHLVVRLEIILSPDGRIKAMGVVKSSGSSEFDIAALDSVERAQPFAPASSDIASADGNVYLHWEFHRDEFFGCSTQGARPFLLR
jgi:TonB family protein